MGAWISYEDLVQKEGLAVATELVENGLVDQRFHTKLRPDTTITFPRNHQFRYTQDVCASMAKTKKTLRKTSTAESSADVSSAFDEAYTASSSARAVGAVEGTTRTAPASQPPPQNMTDVDKKTVAEARAAHAALPKAHLERDRKKREIKGLLGKSNAHTNTCGCSLENRLEANLAEGDKWGAVHQSKDT